MVRWHSLQTRILLFLVACIVVTSICSVVLLVRLNAASRQSELVQRNDVAVDDAARLREEELRMIARTKDVWLRGGKTDPVDAVADPVEQSWQVMTGLRQKIETDIAITPAMRDQLQQYDASTNDYRTTYLAALAAFRQQLSGPDAGNADTRADAAMRGKGLVSSGLIGGFQDQVRAESAWLRADRAASIAVAREAGVIEAALILAMLATIAVWVSRVVGRDVGAVASAATAFAHGQRDVRVPTRGRGEIAQLGHAFNDMVARITGQERQLEELRKIAVALTSATTEHEACDIVVSRLAETFGYRYVSIYLIRPGDPENLHLITQRGYATVIDPIPVPGTVTGRSVRERQPILVADAATDGDFIAAESQILSEAVAPILTPDRVLGTLLLEEDTVGKLTEADLNLITTLANNLSAALENVRLNVEATERIASLRRANRDLAAVTEAGTRLAATLDLDAVYTLVAEEITRIVDAPSIFITAWEEGSDAIHMRVAMDHGVRFAVASLPVDGSLSGWTVLHGAPIYLATEAEVARFMAETGVRPLSTAPTSIFSVPLIAGTQTIGAISIGSPVPHAYSEQERAVVQTIAAQAATAINNARLYARVQEQVAEMRRLNDELERANALKSEFLATMSHELRTPLNAIIGFSELLVDEVVNDREEVHACLTDILNSGRHLLSLINDVLDISKIEAGRMELNRTTFDLREEIAEMARTVAPLIAARGHTLRIVESGSRRGTREAGRGESGSIEHSPDSPTPSTPRLVVHADRQRVRQIILNLVSNAIKFTPDGGTIEVACGRDQSGNRGVVPFFPTSRPPDSSTPAAFARVSVSDTGIGIREEDVPKLFEKFRQLDASHTRRYEGTGLGLALTKQLVELHGGGITVASTFGVGTTFTFTLPLVAPTDDAAPTEHERDTVLTTDD
jgi:signal transduction histidine kinase